MNSSKNILFVYQQDNPQARQFVTTLKSALSGWNITTTAAGITTLLLEIRKYDLVHFFLPAAAKSAQWIRKMRGKTRVIQTVVAPPENDKDYSRVLFGDRIIVFSNYEKHKIAEIDPTREISVIRPCAELAQSVSLEPQTDVRQRYKAADRMLVLALNDFADRNQFNAFLYICRELNRKEGFRLLLPSFGRDRERQLWRDRLRYSIEQERLDAVALLQPEAPLSSLIDSADTALYVNRITPRDFAFPLVIVEALLRGKPLICYNTAPVNEIVQGFQPSWATGGNEDFVRETRDLHQKARKLDEISTEFARHCREFLSVESVAAAHDRLYHKMLATSASEMK